MAHVRDRLGLIPHPEGGAFAEIFRSDRIVRPESHGKARRALTQIYFHLEPGEVSRFHRVESDEAWHLYEGEGLALYEWTPGATEVRRTRLSREEARFCHVVRAGRWQAAAPVSGPVLAGCSVGPGFEFEDFALVDKDSPEADAIRALDPDLERFL